MRICPKVKKIRNCDAYNVESTYNHANEMRKGRKREYICTAVPGRDSEIPSSYSVRKPMVLSATFALSLVVGQRFTGHDQGLLIGK